MAGGVAAIGSDWPGRELVIHYYAELKDFIEAIIGLDRNVLHVHLGIALFVFLAWLFPGPGRYRKAFFWLLFLELINEFIDAMMALDAGRSPNWPDTLADIINTMIWPAVWCLWRHHRRRRAGRLASPAQHDLGDPMSNAWLDPLSRSGSSSPVRSATGTPPPDKGGPA